MRSTTPSPTSPRCTSSDGTRAAGRRDERGCEGAVRGKAHREGVSCRACVVVLDDMRDTTTDVDAKTTPRHRDSRRPDRSFLITIPPTKNQTNSRFVRQFEGAGATGSVSRVALPASAMAAARMVPCGVVGDDPAGFTGPLWTGVDTSRRRVDFSRFASRDAPAVQHQGRRRYPRPSRA